MKTNMIITSLLTAMILINCIPKLQSTTSANDNIATQIATTIKLDENLTKPKDMTIPQRVNAEFEGIHNTLNSDIERLPDSLITQLRNTEVSFCGDTIIINGIKSTYSRRTVATKNIFRQALPLQRFVYNYFSKKGINLKDSVDYLLVEYIYESDSNKKPLSNYKNPGIIYERPYLLIPYISNYCISFIVNIEPSEFNRLMPERRDQRKK